MPTVEVFNMNREKVSEIELPDDIFSEPRYDRLLHEVVRYQRAKARQGTHATKNRSAVSGGGKKPYRQKGTGRARQGTTRAPHYRGGGVVFGPHPRSHAFKLPKKVRANALRSALSRRVVQSRLFVLDALELPGIKTRQMADLLGRFGIESALFVLPDRNANVELSARNIPNVTVLPSVGLNVYDVLRHRNLVLTVPAVQKIRERLAR
ncbi:50S ribosomal protein L4 [Myxococcota bacterium]|nr:50S ribosomal protein L4 [Myxococcota bacterium]